MENNEHIPGSPGSGEDIFEGKEARARIRNEKEFTDTALDAQLDTLFIFEPASGKALRWNRAFREISGYTDEEIAALPAPASYYSDRDLERAEDFIRDVLVEGVGTIELELICRDGTRVPTEYRVSSILDDNGEPRYFISIGRDVTDRKNAERALRDSEHNLLEAQRITHIGSWVWNPDTNRVTCSDEMLRILGFPPQKAVLTFREIMDRVHPRDRDRVRKAIETAVKDGTRYEAEFRIRLPDGDERVIHGLGRVECGNYGEPPVMRGTGQDITGRKRAEQEQIRAAREWQTTFDATNDAIWILDHDHRILSCNKTTERIFRRPRKEMIGKYCWEVLHGTAKPIPECPHMRAKQSLRREAMEIGIGKGWFQVTVDPILDASGKYTGAVHIVSDITRRKRTEEALEKRILALTMPLDDTEHIYFEDLFNLSDIQRLQDEFANATGVASIITHTDGTPITRPSNFCRLCKDIIRKTEKGLVNCYKSDAAIGRLSPDGPIVQPCESGGLWDAGAAISVGGKHIANWLIGQVRDETQTEEMIRKYAREIGAGEEQAVEAFRQVPAMSRERFGQVAQALFTLANQLSATAFQNMQQARFIFDRKRAEEALRESEEKYRRIFENSVAGFFQSTPEGRFINVNPAFAGILGYDSAEEIISGITDIASQYYVDPKDRDRYQQLLMENCSVENFEFMTRCRDGSKKWVSNSTRAYFDRDGKLARFEGVIIDITGRKQAEEEKTRLEEQFHQAQKLESIGRLAGGVAHDLNNLLSPILGYGEMLLEEAAVDDPGREPLEEIVSAGMRARDLVHRLLAFSRKQTLEFKHIDLNALLKNFEKLLRRTIREDIAIHVAPAPSLPLIKGDVGQLEQVVMNLAVNAQDAMPAGGELSVITEQVELDAGHASRHQNVPLGPYVMLMVGDTGCGMDANTLEHLFEPFFTTKGKSRGTGLGLAIVYGIVKQHGGNIRVYSELGRGTTFKVYLPISEEAGGVKKHAFEIPSDLRGMETILLVEDNAQVRELTLAILERQGYTVLVAQSGKDALYSLENHQGPVHLLLTDVVMPEMNGKQLFEKVSGQYPEVKALYMSGYTDNVIAHHGVMDPGVHFIQKPFSIKALAAKVREVLDG